MAMTCRNHAQECDGCQNCYTEPRAIRCPVCGEVLDYGDTIYYLREGGEVLDYGDTIYYLREGGDVLGCEICIGTKDADTLGDF